MTELEPRARPFVASDGYLLHVLEWPASRESRGLVVVLHGVQSHGGWYHGLGRRLAAAGYTAIFPDRRGSGANQKERGHTSSSKRLSLDITELIASRRAENPGLPVTLAGISWGGKLAVIGAAGHPDLIDAVALICPGLHPRVGVSLKERLKIAWAFLTRRRRYFPIPLSDPALFTDNPEAQAFIGSDPLSLRQATEGLLAASFFIDRRVRSVPGEVRQPCLLMLAGHDRIVDNVRTREYFQKIAAQDKSIIEYPEGHHTLEFDPDPSEYARDLIVWLDTIFEANPAQDSRVEES
jgi:acylglycerol lipase